MKHVTSRVLGFLLSVTLTFTPATHARMNGVAPQTDLTTATNTPDSHGLVTNVLFDGQYLSKGFVTNLAADSVVAWGAIFNEMGTDTVDGELWFIVAKGDQLIYYHLTDQPNSGTGSATYGGYTVKMKTVMTLQVYNFGFGSTVRVIGNDTDAFLVTTTEIYVNSSLTEGFRPISGATASSETLVHVFDEVESYNIPLSSSAGRWVRLTLFAPDGTLLGDEWKFGTIANASSSSCENFGDTVGNVVSMIPAIAGVLNVAFTNVQSATLTSIFSGATGNLGSKGAIGGGMKVLTAGQVGIQTAVATVATVATDFIYSQLAEAACDVATNVLDDLSHVEIDLPGVEDISFTQTVMACDRYGTALVGSSASDDGSGGIVVTGHTEQVCTKWHYEQVPA